MRRGKLRAVKPVCGGGCRSKSTKPWTGDGGTGIETDTGLIATVGAQCPAAVDPKKWFTPGTVFLQQSQAFALGAHLPFRQQAIASRVRAVAKQSNGCTSITIAKKVTTIWTPRFISNLQSITNLDVRACTSFVRARPFPSNWQADCTRFRHVSLCTPPRVEGGAI